MEVGIRVYIIVRCVTRGEGFATCSLWTKDNLVRDFYLSVAILRVIFMFSVYLIA